MYHACETTEEKLIIWKVQKIVKLIANPAQITQNVTSHALKHTLATLVLQKGISLAAVQKILGYDRADDNRYLFESN